MNTKLGLLLLAAASVLFTCTVFAKQDVLHKNGTTIVNTPARLGDYYSNDGNNGFTGANLLNTGDSLVNVGRTFAS